jgi:hypothetical protein
MNDDKRSELFSQFCKLDSEKYEKYIELVKSEVDRILEEIIPKGCWTLGVKMKDKNVVAKIVLDSNETKYIYKNIEIDNEYVWSYIVNVKYYNNRKIISVFESKESFDPITLEQSIYTELDELYNDEEYLKLIEELRIINKICEPHETKHI